MGTRVISAALTLKDRDFSSNLRKASERTDDLGRKVTLVGNKVKRFSTGVSDSFKRIGKAAGAVSFAALGVGAAGLATSVGSSVIEIENSIAKLQAQTGLVGEDLKVLEGAAKETFKRGFGESLDEVTSAVSRVKQNMHGIDDSKIADATSSALLLANTFESDVNEVTRGVNNTMQAFGVSSDKAFDLFTAGGQRGLNLSNEMFDNVAEYAPLFGKMGYTAEEYFGILERGAKAGVYNLDYVNDVMKEFQIRVKDGSKLTADSMDSMSESTQKVWQEFLKGNGTVSEVASTVVDELKGMDDQVAANQIAVGLFGTKFEDLESDAVYAMLGTTDAMKDFEGATEKAADAITGTFGSRISQVWRDLKLSLADVAKEKGASELLDSMAKAAEDLVPKIMGVVDGAIDFANTIKDNWGIIRETLIGVATAAGILLTAFMAFKVVAGITALYKGFRAALALATAGQWAMNTALLASPITWVVGLIAGLVTAGVLLYRNWDKVKNGWESVWGKIKSSAGSGVNFVVDQINKLIGVINKIPGVNVPIVAKVNWDQATQHAKTNVNVASPTKVDKTYGVSAKPKKTTTSGIDKSYGIKASYAVGADRLTKDHIAQVHKDEMIIPARQAEKVRRAGYNIDNIGNIGQQKQTGGNNIEININGVGASTDQIVNELVPKLKMAIANI